MGWVVALDLLCIKIRYVFVFYVFIVYTLEDTLDRGLMLSKTPGISNLRFDTPQLSTH